MAAPDTGTPPLPPDVRRQQQGPALAQYAQSAMANGTDAMQQQGAGASMQFVKQTLGTIADGLTQIAKVVAVEKPALIPILTRMAGMGKVLEQELSKSQGQGAPMQPGTEPAQAAMSAPEGPAAMGM